MLRKMVSGGFRRKDGSYHYVLRNDDIVKRCKTESLISFMGRQQRNFMAHVIRMDNERVTKRMLFNNDKTTIPGRRINVYKTVIENERMTSDEFNKNSLARKF